MDRASTLLIDDYPQFREELRDLLHDDGVALDCASTWEEGLELFLVGLHELVIADYNLPGSSNGLKLLAAIKVLRPSSRLVLISGQLTSRGEAIATKNALVDAYYTKTSALGETLLAEAQSAAKRAEQAADWRTLAFTYLAGQRVHDEDIDFIDAILRGEVTDP